MKISDFINEPWRDIGQDAMKRGTEICKRNEESATLSTKSNQRRTSA